MYTYIHNMLSCLWLPTFSILHKSGRNVIMLNFLTSNVVVFEYVMSGIGTLSNMAVTIRMPCFIHYTSSSIEQWFLHVCGETYRYCLMVGYIQASSCAHAGRLALWWLFGKLKLSYHVRDCWVLRLYVVAFVQSNRDSEIGIEQFKQTSV